MPLWLIFHPAGTFEDKSSKQAFSENITKMYLELGLPAFYVVANFIKMSSEDVWLGGKQNTGEPFIRIVINHVAYVMPDEDAVYRQATSRIDQILKPHIADRGYHWEYHVDETDRRLWKIDGLIPPAYKCEMEQLWVKENRAIPYEGGY